MLNIIFFVFLLILIIFIFNSILKAIAPLFSIIKKYLYLLGVFAFAACILIVLIAISPFFLQTLKLFFQSAIVNLVDISSSGYSNNILSAGLILISQLAILIYVIYLIRKCFKWIFEDESINNK